MFVEAWPAEDYMSTQFHKWPDCVGSCARVMMVLVWFIGLTSPFTCVECSVVNRGCVGVIVFMEFTSCIIILALSSLSLPCYLSCLQQTDSTVSAIDVVLSKTKEFLQPNPSMSICLSCVACVHMCWCADSKAHISIVMEYQFCLFVFLSYCVAARLKLAMKGKGASSYPQPEGALGDVMLKSGADFGDESAFGK